ncbi:MAG: DUF1934 domain-containing protein [Eubacterium sp.]
MNKILLEIIGTQRIDNQKDKMELTTIGTFEENSDTYIIKYTEEQEPPTAPVNVCVKINKNERAVEMTRSGAFDSCLIIEKSKRNLCHYGTEYGDILMGISGHTIEGEYADDKGRFTFSYDIDINGALASRNEVKMTFRNNRE